MLGSFLLLKHPKPVLTHFVFDIPSAYCSSSRYLHGSLPHLLFISRLYLNIPSKLWPFCALDRCICVQSQLGVSYPVTCFSFHLTIYYKLCLLSYSLPLSPLETMFPKVRGFCLVSLYISGTYNTAGNDTVVRRRKGGRNGERENYPLLYCYEVIHKNEADLYL